MEDKPTFPIFDNGLLFSSKTIKIGVKKFVLPNEQNDICDYNL